MPPENVQDLLQLQPWPVLRVVGGAESGLVVREGTALTSQVLGRLAYGALVEERISGPGEFELFSAVEFSVFLDVFCR
jgi:hypothetical protein